MELNVYEIAWAIARYERMVSSKLDADQKGCADRYGALVDRHFARLDTKKKCRVLGMVPFFMGIGI